MFTYYQLLIAFDPLSNSLITNKQITANSIIQHHHYRIKNLIYLTLIPSAV